eukprot:gnl/Spiro4/12517_TR6613_c0_g1_i1.p2 gnl/Spiro4/12517_TR6613_c0_g1~~gnl/Spiro4/12517_TR6613_c0_g1_i1.p2  ORF type:complete len:135 (+),score=29.30 gnl/Spiro4/12517_TR6613_c0_g1_i1:30-434(+)
MLAARWCVLVFGFLLVCGAATPLKDVAGDTLKLSDVIAKYRFSFDAEAIWKYILGDDASDLASGRADSPFDSASVSDDDALNFLEVFTAENGESAEDEECTTACGADPTCLCLPCPSAQPCVCECAGAHAVAPL